MKKTILIAAPIATRSGYGAHSRDIALSLIKSDIYNVTILPLAWGNTPLTALNENTDNNKLLLEKIVHQPPAVKPDIFIHITIPNEFQPLGICNIGITAGIETTLCHSDWIEGCNRMDLVITTSQHSADIFTNSAFDKLDKNTGAKVGTLTCETPIQVLFEGIDSNIYNITSNIESEVTKLMDTVSEDFNFLFVGQWIQGDLGHDRKDIGMLIKTFIETFKDKSIKNRPGLIVKTNLAGYSKTEEFEIKKRIEFITKIAMGDSKGTPPNIYVIHGEMTDAEINSLYNHPKVKAMVSFTKGEGFGRPLLEFASIGKPVLASNWSGHLDFLSVENHLLLPGELRPVHPSALNNWIVPEAQWFTVNYLFAGMAMVDVMQNYAEYNKKSRKYVNTIKDKFSMAAMSKLLLELLDKYSSNTSIQPETIKLPKLQVL